jgi:predicted aminopeptidase
MAKTNMVEREKRRAKIVKKYAGKRAELKELIRSPKTGADERAAAQVALQKMRARVAAATAAPSRAGRVACTENSDWRGSKSAKQSIVASCLASRRRAGKEATQ